MKVLALIACVLAVSAQTSWAGYPLAHHGYPYSYGGYPYNSQYGYGSALPYGLHAYGPYAHGAYAHGIHAHGIHGHGIHAHGAYTNVHGAYTNVHAYKPAYAPYAHAYGVSQQYHAQDALGGYSYGYTDGLSSKKESRNAYGGTVGSYSYVDAAGKHQTVSYVADAQGFRVKATNLPVGPSTEAAPNAEAPAPVQDTAEVKAAKEQFKKLYDEAAAAAEQAPDTPAAVVPDHSYHRYRRSAVPKPVEDTPSVKAAKAHHAYLYNKAAAAAAAAPDHPYGYHGYHGLHGHYGPYGYPAAGVYSGYHGHYPGYYAAPYYRKGFSYAFSSPHAAPYYHGHHY